MFAHGITSLGKYTLPNSLALPIKVDELPLRQLEKKRPQNVACHKKQKLRHSVSWYIGNHTENYGKNKCWKERLYYYPQRSEYGLLVGIFKITLYEQHNKVTVLSDITEIKLKQSAFWSNIGYFIIFQATFPFCRYFTYKKF